MKVGQKNDVEADIQVRGFFNILPFRLSKILIIIVNHLNVKKIEISEDLKDLEEKNLIFIDLKNDKKGEVFHKNAIEVVQADIST